MSTSGSRTRLNAAFPSVTSMLASWSRRGAAALGDVALPESCAHATAEAEADLGHREDRDVLTRHRLPECGRHLCLGGPSFSARRSRMSAVRPRSQCPRCPLLEPDDAWADQRCLPESARWAGAGSSGSATGLLASPDVASGWPRWLLADASIGRMNDCKFCEIVAGRLPSFRVLQDEHTVAFLDIRPASPGHTLVVPREHARDIWAISEATHGRVARMVHQVSALVKARLGPDGVNVRHATGEAAGQEVFHFHTHVIPRWHGDNLPAMRRSAPASRSQLEQVLAQITSAGTT